MHRRGALPTPHPQEAQARAAVVKARERQREVILQVQADVEEARRRETEALALAEELKQDYAEWKESAAFLSEVLEQEESAREEREVDENEAWQAFLQEVWAFLALGAWAGARVLFGGAGAPPPPTKVGRFGTGGPVTAGYMMGDRKVGLRRGGGRSPTKNKRQDAYNSCTPYPCRQGVRGNRRSVFGGVTVTLARFGSEAQVEMGPSSGVTGICWERLCVPQHNERIVRDHVDSSFTRVPHFSPSPPPPPDGRGR